MKHSRYGRFEIPGGYLPLNAFDRLPTLSDAGVLLPSPVRDDIGRREQAVTEAAIREARSRGKPDTSAARDGAETTPQNQVAPTSLPPEQCDGRLRVRVLDETELQAAVTLPRASSQIKAALRGTMSRTADWHDQWRTRLAELEDEMPNFGAALAHVRRQITLAEAAGRPARVPPMLLLGAPGLGKTRFARRLAEALGVPSEMLSYADPSAGSRLLGDDASWSDAQQGLLWRTIVSGTAANPVVFLDELDKAGVVRSSVSGERDPRGELMGVLEPETARRAREQSLRVHFDASHVLYVAAANSIARIPTPMLSRFELISIPQPTARQRLAIVKSVARDLLRDAPGSVSLARDVLPALAPHSPRVQRRLLLGALAVAVEAGRFEVTLDDVAFGPVAPSFLH